jgi:hypothetical protein
MASLAKVFSKSSKSRRQRRDGRSGAPRPNSIERLERRLPLDATGMSPTGTFVAAAFEQVLVREVDTVSLTAFSTSLQNGAISRNAFTETLTHSVEYFSSVISSDYSHYLGRAPDAAGVAFWNGLMQQGMTDEQLEAQLIGTPEYFNHAGGSNQAWVNRMYFDLLGRSPDLQGEAAWVNALGAGMPRSLAAYGFASSAEHEAIIVRNDYEVFLGRPASDGEVGGWVQGFGEGLRNEDIIAGFVGSDEFFNSHDGQSGQGGAGVNVGSGSVGSVNIGTINIGTVNININSGNINSGNVDSGNVNSGNVSSGDDDSGDDGPGDHGPGGGPHKPHGNH